MPVETVSPMAAAFGEFEAAFGGTPGETASKKPASTKGSSKKRKKRKATHPPVPPDLTEGAYGAPSVLPPPGPSKTPGRPKTHKRYRNRGGLGPDRGKVFKLKRGNKEEPLVDASSRRQRQNAGMNPWLDEGGEWV